jgi:BASS family bile acid:Na+ symporter
LIGWVWAKDLQLPTGTVASVVLASVLVPLAIGLVVHEFARGFAERIADGVAIAGTILLVVAFVPVLFETWPAVVAAVGNGTIFSLLIFAVVGVAVGHTLGGPTDDDRTVLAMATAIRHPGVALAIAGAAFPDVKGVLAVVLWHLIIGAVVTLPYVYWRKRLHDRHSGGAFAGRYR